jgi:hypothetical protein
VSKQFEGHLDEQQLLDYRYGETQDAAAIEQHLHECAECKKSYDALAAVLAMVEAAPVPEPDANFEARMWRAVSPKLARRGFDWSAWAVWFAPRRLVPIGAVAALVIAAFFVGRYMPRPNGSGAQQGGAVSDVAVKAPAPAQVRERILLVAVGDHLDKAQSVLLEISNAEPEGPGSEARHGDVDISQDQQRAESLLAANRIYRQTAEHAGDSAVANVLDELEPVLLDIVHSPSKVSAANLAELQKRIESQGLLLKVRVLDSTVKNKTAAPAAQTGNRGS